MDPQPLIRVAYTRWGKAYEWDFYTKAFASRWIASLGSVDDLRITLPHGIESHHQRMSSNRPRREPRMPHKPRHTRHPLHQQVRLWN